MFREIALARDGNLGRPSYALFIVADIFSRLLHSLYEDIAKVMARSNKTVL